MLLRCLSNIEAAQAVGEAHARICGAHQSGAKLHFQIKRIGYYWPTIYHANFIHQPPEPLHPTSAGCPFYACGLDMVGPMLWFKEGYTYILAATDYFSKCTEAKPIMSGK
ncbi:hypothetical protein LIER_23096 [Lithospermum erythrorhizon]|uniref:Uncharacterized protein n=1 Tax=Lithospermum erythrorhizon TaxID=34254 RepID=A0AAV3QW77_LITER